MEVVSGVAMAPGVGVVVLVVAAVDITMEAPRVMAAPEGMIIRVVAEKETAIHVTTVTSGPTVIITKVRELKH